MVATEATTIPKPAALIRRMVISAAVGRPGRTSVLQEEAEEATAGEAEVELLPTETITVAAVEVVPISTHRLYMR
jgi:hypothetical protein